MDRAEKQQLVGSAEWLRQQIETEINPAGDYRLWIVATYPDHVIVENATDGQNYRYPYTVDGETVEVGAPEQVELQVVVKSPELTGPFVFPVDAAARKAQAKKQIALAPVLVPGEPDSDGEVLTAEKIEEVAHAWMEHYRAIDDEHTLDGTEIDTVPVESYIAPQDLEFELGAEVPGAKKGEVVTIPQGSWMLAGKVRSAEAWEAVEKGERNGWSVLGVSKAELEAAASKSDMTAALFGSAKRTLLEDLGPDWVAPFVSLVKSPAVPKAKWVALKSAAVPDEVADALFGQITDALGVDVAEKKGQRFSKATRSSLRDLEKSLRAAAERVGSTLRAADESAKSEEDPEMDAKAVREIIAEELPGALKTALAEVQAEKAEETPPAEKAETPVEEPAAEPKAEEETPAETPPAAEKGDGFVTREDFDALKSSVDELVDGLKGLIAGEEEGDGEEETPEPEPAAAKTARKGMEPGDGGAAPQSNGRDSWGRRVPEAV